MVTKDSEQMAVKIVGRAASTGNASFGRHSTNTTFTLVSEVSAQNIKVMAMKVHAEGAVNFHVQTGTTEISGLVTLGAGDSEQWSPTNPGQYWFQTDAGRPLRMSLSTTDTTVDAEMIYITE